MLAVREYTSCWPAATGTGTAADAGTLSDKAMDAAARLPVWQDESDRARPRPVTGDPAFERWESFSRTEMSSWYWAHINGRYLEALEAVPREDWIRLDYTSATAPRVMEVAAFLGLEGIRERDVDAMLRRKILLSMMPLFARTSPMSRSS